jgi:type IV secretory pathway TraG/TraD family ATPase VirD4
VRDDVGVFLGRVSDGIARASPQRSVLALGPSRSGKTSSLIVPNLLISDRAVIATSTKDDVVRQLANARRDVATLVFDPSGTVEIPSGATRVGYSPLLFSQEWDGAVLATRSLVQAARMGFGERADDHWTERAGALVAPMLHAAALSGSSLGELASTIDQRRGDGALALLRERYGELHPAPAVLAGVLASEDRERSGIWSTASGLFAGLRTEAARRASREAPLDIDRFLSGRHHLHVVAPSRHQRVAAPLVIGLIDQVVEATYRRHHDGSRLLLALDELANVAPLPSLASVVSEGGGQGVVTIACLQDLSQARSRWGASADGFLSLFPTTVIFPGVADRRTLEVVSALGGREMVATPSIQRNARGRSVGHSVHFSERDRLSVADLARGRVGHVLALDETKTPRWVALAPAHHDELFARYRRIERPGPSRARSGPSR